MIDQILTMHCNDKSDFTETCIEAYRLIYKIIFPTHRKTLLHDATFGHKNTSAWHDKNPIEKGKSFLLRLNKLLQLSSLSGRLSSVPGIHSAIVRHEPMLRRWNT